MAFEKSFEGSTDQFPTGPIPEAIFIDIDRNIFTIDLDDDRTSASIEVRLANVNASENLDAPSSTTISPYGTL